MSNPGRPSAGQLLRSHMPVAQDYAYFDHAAVAPLPDVTAAAIVQYTQQASQQGDIPWLTWAGRVAELRKSAASLLGASGEEIALVHNTTHGINLIAESFPWRSGDNVVVPDNEFPSNMLPWKSLERRGVELRRVAVAAGGELDLERIDQAIDGRTRILSLSWVGFASGYRVDVAAAVELAHRRGCLFLLDAIQGLGVFPLDVRQCPVDFLCADGHKWLLGPEGAGILFVQQQHLELLEPCGLGWNSLAAGGFDPHSTRLKSTAARYEGGSTNMPGMIGLGASLQLLNELHGSNPPAEQGGTTPLAAAVLDNVQQLQQRLQQAEFQVHLPPQVEHRSGILGISWEASQAPTESVYAAARQHCLRRGVVLSVRGGYLRASTHAYNNAQDMQRLVDALLEFRRL